MKKIFAIVFTVIIMGCTPHEENMVLIQDYIKDCTSELIQAQLDSNVRIRSYNFLDEKFSLYIDSTGKPIFVEEMKMIDEVIFYKDETNYIAEINNGVIKISRQ